MAGLFHPNSVEGGRERPLLLGESRLNNTLGAFPNVMVKCSQKQGAPHPSLPSLRQPLKS